MSLDIRTSWVKSFPKKEDETKFIPGKYAEPAVTIEELVTCIRTGIDLYSVDFKWLIGKIRASDSKARQVLKPGLQAFLPGLYKATGRHADEIKSFQIMVFDLDHLRDFEEARKLTKTIPEVLIDFKSPSGDGLKVVVAFSQPYTTSDTDEKLRIVYTRIYKYLAEKLFKLPELDEKTVDAGRLCFLSYDPDIYINPSPKLIEITEDLLKEALEQEKNEIPLDVNSSYKKLEFKGGIAPEYINKEVELASKAIICNSYSDWLKIAFSLSKLGDFGYKTFYDISKRNTKYKDSDSAIKEQWEKCIKSPPRDKEITLGSYFMFAKSLGFVHSPNYYSTVKRHTSNLEDKFWEFVSKEKKAKKEKTKVTKEKKVKDKKEDTAIGIPELEGQEIISDPGEMLKSDSDIEEIDFSGREVHFPDQLIHDFLKRHNFYRHTFQGDTISTISWAYAKDNIITQASLTSIVHYLIGHIDSYNMPESDKYEVQAAFLAKHGEFSKASKYLSLPFLKIDLLRDTPKNTFFTFRNGWVDITADSISLKPYTELRKHIYKSDIINRNFTVDTNLSRFSFYTFLKNITFFSEDSERSNRRLASLMSAIGYLLHRYCDSEHAIIITDETVSDGYEDANGGTGKSLLGKAISKVRKVAELDGKLFRIDKGFIYQSVEENTNTIFFNDVKQNFRFVDVFNLCSDGIEVEKKNKQSFRLEGVHRPKVLITTNYAIVGGGSSYDRR